MTNRRMPAQPSATMERMPCPADSEPDSVPDFAPTRSSADVLRELGLEVVIQLLERTQHGVVVCAPDRRYVYANPAACRIGGRSFAELTGRDFLASFPEREHGSMVEYFAQQLTGVPAWHTSTLARPDGEERDVTWSAISVEVDGTAFAAATFTDITALRDATLTAAELAQTAGVVSSGTSTREILAGIARAAVETTGATGCGIMVVDEQGLIATGGHGVPREFGDAVARGLQLSDIPGYDVFAAGRPAVVPDAREQWRAGAVTAPVEATVGDIDWVGGVYLPMTWQGELIGCLGIYLPTAAPPPSPATLAFWTALADQAAVALVGERLRARSQLHAALIERQRLARELHDSVSQALFSMTLHARTAERHLAAAGLGPDTPAGRDVARLIELSRGALAEMRAMIFELRPGALAEEGLVAALTRQAAALTAREGLVVTVTGPAERPPLDPEVEEHVYRIVLEALHNTVKHAAASRATVDVAYADGILRVDVTDDGRGFDPSAVPPGHLGQQTMRERAAASGGSLNVTSRPGGGTVVSVRVPGDSTVQSGYAAGMTDDKRSTDNPDDAATSGLGSVADQKGNAPTGKGPAPYSLRDDDSTGEERRSDSGT